MITTVDIKTGKVTQRPLTEAEIAALPVVTEEDLAREAHEIFKQERVKAVAAIVVLVDIDENTAYLFDGDETSQTRMARVMVTMTDTDVTPWVLADNTPVMVTKAQLAVALRKAAEEQARLWVYNPTPEEQVLEVVTDGIN